MGICWYCYWGWSKPVAKLYKKARKKLNNCDDYLCYSAGHIVWADENFDNDSIQACLDNFDRWKNEDYTDEQNLIVLWSLKELLKIPEDERCIEPKDYDNKHPENYPPTVEVEKV